MVISGGPCYREPQMARMRGHQADHERGIEAGRILVAIAGPDFQVVSVAAGHGETIRKKRHVELPPFQRLCDLRVVVGVQEAAEPGFRMTPDCVTVGAVPCNQESSEVDLSRSHWSCPLNVGDFLILNCPAGRRAFGATQDIKQCGSGFYFRVRWIFRIAGQSM
jgi:hypothetical protein